MQQHQKERLTLQLLDQLQPLVLADRIEVLAQLMIRWGVAHILRDSPELAPEEAPLTPEEIIELVAIDKRRGETIGGALAHQGLLMLMWLESGEK